MKDKIRDLAALVFDDIPYSPETQEAQSKITAALAVEYDKLCAKSTEGEAFDRLLAEYGSL